MSRIHIIFEGKELTRSEFNEIEKYVLNYFHLLWDDIRNSVYTLREKNQRFIKSELCLSFVGADSLSRFREILNTGQEEKRNEDRFREWLDDFVFNDKNEVYRMHKHEINCDSFISWKLRSSLLHFYGLPRLESEYIGFATLDADIIKKLRKFVRESYPGKHARVINPYRLIEAIISGLLTQLETLQEIIKGNDDARKEIYVRGIVKCYEVIDAEGASYFPFKKK